MCYNFSSEYVTILALDVLEPLNLMRLVSGQGVLALAVVRIQAWKERIYISLQQWLKFFVLNSKLGNNIYYLTRVRSLSTLVTH